MSAGHDVIVVGSGPAGTFATLKLQGLNVLMLDVGKSAPERLGEDAGLIELRRQGRAQADDILGPDFESLHNIGRDYLTPKLKAPQLRYVAESWRELSPVVEQGFETLMSFARGGLANAWGAGTYRFNDVELDAFPFAADALEPFYDEATEHIGIAGRDDDAGEFFGSTKGLLGGLELSYVGRDLLAAYEKRRSFFRRRGVVLGYPRIAVLTEDHGERSAYRYTGAEYFRPRLPGIYNPAFTLEDLVDANKVDYRAGRLVESFEEDEQGVTVTCRDLETGAVETHRARRLVLAAGALNTAKIVLRSRRDTDARLPILDNLVSFIPLLNLARVGWSPPKRSLPLQLNLIYSGPLEDEAVQASCYGMSAPMASDFAFEFPLSVGANLKLIKYVLPALTTIQLFYPDPGSPDNTLRLGDDDRLHIGYRPRERGRLERHLVSTFLRAGYFSLPALCKTLPAGHSFHYAGTLPMRSAPQSPYETDVDGLLHGTRGVYVADAANFSTLPSKNLTFTIMANAMRIADGLRRRA